MRCPDVEGKVEHESHWHVIRAAGITIAQGQCPGYKAPECICYTPKDLEKWGHAPVPGRPLNICPVHHPRLHAMRLRNAEVRHA